MNKREFIEELRTGLNGLPSDDVEERVSFYNEMIDDRMEEGLSEEDAVNDIGNAREIASQIIAETPLTKIVKEKIKPKRTLKAWEIVLIFAGMPFWLPILIAFIVVVLALYVCLWSLIIALTAAFVALIAGGFLCLIESIYFFGIGNLNIAIAVIALGMVCLGLSVFMFFANFLATKGLIILTKKMIVGLKNCIVKKEV